MHATPYPDGTLKERARSREVAGRFSFGAGHMLKAADLSFSEVRGHMAHYLRAGYKTRTTWTIIVPAENLKGEKWGDILQRIWLDVRSGVKAYDLNLCMEDLGTEPHGKVRLLIGVRRK
jgi:hypothetical protein